MLVQSYLQRKLREDPAGIPDVASLYALARTKQVAFLSTALLLDPEPQLASILSVQDQTTTSQDMVVSVAASLSRNHSKDPRIHAIVREALQRNLIIREVEVDAVPLGGLTGKLERTWYVLGSAECMQVENIELGVASLAVAQQAEAEGKEVLFLAQKQPKRLLAIFTFSSRVSTVACECVAQLQSLGMEPVLYLLEPSMRDYLVAQEVGIEVCSSPTKLDNSTIGISEQRTVRTFPKHLLQCHISPGKKSWPYLSSLADVGKIIVTSRELLHTAKKTFFWLHI